MSSCKETSHHTADRIHGQDDQDSEDTGTDAIHHRDAITAGNARENDSTREDGLSKGFRPWIGLQGGFSMVKGRYCGANCALSSIVMATEVMIEEKRRFLDSGTR